jgi:O-antigen ligase
MGCECDARTYRALAVERRSLSSDCSTRANQADSTPRFIAASIFLALAAVVSLVFQGTAANLLYLAATAASLLVALSCVGTGAILQRLDANRWGFGLVLAMLGYLVVAYRLSISPDNSFAASWVLAAAPLAFIAGSAVMRNSAATRVLTTSTSTLVIALAAVSSVRFVLLGERAQQPLVDPNNYATLMYLVWVPLAHRYLAQGWRGEPTALVRHSWVLASSFVLVLAIIATRSRTALLIVGGALAVWVLVAAVRRTAWARLLVQLGVVGLAIVVALAVNMFTDVPTKGLEFGGGLSVRYELIRSALAIFAQHPLGIGVFCFSLLYPSHRSLLEQDTAGLFVHNDYVQLLVEGGVPLLILLLLFSGSVVVRARALLRFQPRDVRFAELGFALALAAVCTHALVNFVFYSLPLGILIGVMSAQLFADPLETPAAARSIQMPRGAIGVGIAMGWVMWLYLALDVATVGVFQGQSSLGLGAFVRADEHRMLEYARVAQRINGNRGIPALGEAILLFRAARAEPNSSYLPERAYQQFHRALAVDPWNTLIYLRLAQFLEEFPPSAGRAPGESTEELLLSAISLDPLYVPAIDQVLQHYAATSHESKSYALLRNVVYPWMARLRRDDPKASDRYFDLLQGYAAAAQDETFIAELAQRRSELASILPRPEKPWFL